MPGRRDALSGTRKRTKFSSTHTASKGRIMLCASRVARQCGASCVISFRGSIWETPAIPMHGVSLSTWRGRHNGLICIAKWRRFSVYPWPENIPFWEKCTTWGVCFMCRCMMDKNQISYQAMLRSGLSCQQHVLSSASNLRQSLVFGARTTHELENIKPHSCCVLSQGTEQTPLLGFV
jgi:hypothetical protein